MEKCRSLEASAAAYIELAADREKVLTERVKSLSRKLKRREDYIAELEEDNELLDEKLAKIEGKVSGVVAEARKWNAREKELVNKCKDESLLAKHLAQREQIVLADLRETAAKLERSEKRVKEAEEEIAELTKYISARKNSGKEDSNVAAAASTADPILGAGPPPPVNRKGNLRRKKGSHQRSESLGAAMLSGMLANGGNSNSGSGNNSSGGGSSGGAGETSPNMGEILSPSPSVKPSHYQNIKSHSTLSNSDVPLSLISPRSSIGSNAAIPSQDFVRLRQTSPANGGERGGSHRSSRDRSSRTKSVTRGDVDPAVLGLIGGAEERTSGSTRSRRRSRTVKEPIVTAAEVMGDDNISAETLAQVEAEITELLSRKK
jgi:hypothetical protein